MIGEEVLTNPERIRAVMVARCETDEPERLLRGKKVAQRGLPSQFIA